MVTQRERWLADREGSVGGSEAAAVIGQNPFASRHGLWQRKTGVAPPEDTKIVMRFGSHTEPFIDELFCEEMSRETVDLGEFTIQRRDDAPYMHATLDRQIMPCPGRDMPGVLQIKNVSAHLRNQWVDEIPLHVQIQIQHEMYVSKHTWGSAAALIGGRELIVHDVERDDEFCEYLKDACRDFMRWVRDGHEPPALDDDLEAIKAFYPEAVIDDAVNLPEEAKGLTEVILAAKARIKNDESIVSGVEARLRQLIQTAAIADVPGCEDGRWHCKTVKKKGFEVKPSTSRPLRWVKTKGS